jgi:hypothetical protein
MSAETGSDWSSFYVRPIVAEGKAIESYTRTGAKIEQEATSLGKYGLKKLEGVREPEPRTR